MEREIFYDSKDDRFYYMTKSKNYIDRKTILKKFLGNSHLLHYNLFENEVGFLLDIQEEKRIDFYIFKNYNLVTNLKFYEDFTHVFQDFSFPDLISHKINVNLPQNFYGLLTVENDFKDNFLSKQNSSLLMIDIRDCKSYRFLANNLYDNSSICFGDSPKKIENYLNLAEKGFKIFTETPCNNDLSFRYASEFLNFKVTDENLTHDPIKFPLEPIGLSTEKTNYIKKIMGEFKI